jgi:hypothetical protein
MKEVAVEDVKALAAKQAEEPSGVREVAKAPHAKCEDGHTQASELGGQGSGRSQAADIGAEARAVEPADRLQKNPLRSPDVKVGDEVEDGSGHGEIPPLLG